MSDGGSFGEFVWINLFNVQAMFRSKHPFNRPANEQIDCTRIITADVEGSFYDVVETPEAIMEMPS
jgi:hypothetical protein